MWLIIWRDNKQRLCVLRWRKFASVIFSTDQIANIDTYTIIGIEYVAELTPTKWE